MTCGTGHLRDAPSGQRGRAAELCSWRETRLAHGGQVGDDSKVLLGAAPGDTEACHDLVEAQEGALGLGEVAQLLEELLGGGDESRVADDGLENDACDLPFVCREESLDALDVVVGSAQGPSCRAGKRAERCGKSISREPRALPKRLRRPGVAGVASSKQPKLWSRRAATEAPTAGWMLAREA